MPIVLDLSPAPWQAVNDGVMGGVSSGRIAAVDGGLRFEGHLSLENNGGFASVRRVLDVDLAATGGVRLRLRGDGRRYQFRLRKDERFDGVAWRAEFVSSTGWSEIELPYSAFEPVHRGRPVPEAGPVLPGRIRQAGFMLADRREGPFRLDIGRIEFA